MVAELMGFGERFRLEVLLHSGAAAAVHRALDSAAGRPVAVKVIRAAAPPGNAAGRDRFLHGARTVQSLGLKCFPPFLDSGVMQDGAGFLVMDLIQGVGFGTLTGAPPNQIVPVLAQVAQSLEPLAQVGVYHHNLCPENLLLVATPGGVRAQVMGFGTAALLDPPGRLAPASRSVEALAFAAPELLAPPDQAPGADAGADLYSLARVACLLLEARVQPGPEGEKEVRLPERVGSELTHPDELESVLSLALHADPRRRRITMAEFASALHHAAQRSRVGARADAPPEAVEQTAPIPVPVQDGAPGSAGSSQQTKAEGSGSAPPPPPPPRRADAKREEPGSPAGEGKGSEDRTMAIPLPPLPIGPGEPAPEAARLEGGLDRTVAVELPPPPPPTPPRQADGEEGKPASPAWEAEGSEDRTMAIPLPPLPIGPGEPAPEAARLEGGLDRTVAVELPPVPLGHPESAPEAAAPEGGLDRTVAVELPPGEKPVEGPPPQPPAGLDRTVAVQLPVPPPPPAEAAQEATESDPDSEHEEAPPTLTTQAIKLPAPVAEAAGEGEEREAAVDQVDSEAAVQPVKESRVVEEPSKEGMPPAAQDARTVAVSAPPPAQGDRIGRPAAGVGRPEAAETEPVERTSGGPGVPKLKLRLGARPVAAPKRPSEPLPPPGSPAPPALEPREVFDPNKTSPGVVARPRKPEAAGPGKAAPPAGVVRDSAPDTEPAATPSGVESPRPEATPAAKTAPLRPPEQAAPVAPPAAPPAQAPVPQPPGRAGGPAAPPPPPVPAPAPRSAVAPAPPAAPPVPPAAPAVPSPEMAGVPPSPAVRASGGGGVPRWVWAVVGGTVLLLGALALAVFLGRPSVQRPPPAAPPPAPVAVADPVRLSEREIDTRLAEAEAALEAGDLARAQEVLASIPATDVIAFSPEERTSYHAMLEELQGVSRQQAVEQLRSAFAAGNLTRLRRAVNALSGLDRSELAAEGRDVPELLVQSRRAIQLHSRLQESVRAGDHAAVLERSAEFLVVLPSHGGAQNQREQAARALEERSREEERAGRYESAAEFLRVIQRRWPERAGLETGIARVLQLHEAIQQGRRSLNAALLTLEQGRPDEGLRMLGDAPPHPSLQQEIRDARQQLQARLAELDVQPPAVTLADDSDLRFRRNEAAVIRLRVVDDYRVEGVRAWVRNEANPQYREIPARHGGGNQYRIEVPVQLHGNQPVDFYVEARDVSGNIGTLGSPEQPIEMRRRGLFGR